MRAMLRANSSTSAEPPLAGSDGALTVTASVRGFRRRPGFGLSRPRIDSTHNRGETHHGPSLGKRRSRGRASPVTPPALTLLWSYWGTRPCFQLLELAAILPRRGEAGRRGGVANRRGLELA